MRGLVPACHSLSGDIRPVNWRCLLFAGAINL